MSIASLGLILVAILVGALPPLQAGINATIAGYHGHPLWGALTNTVVASLALLGLIVLLRVPGSDLRAVAGAPAWSWAGGLMGAAMVLSAIILAPRLGAAAFVSAMVVGTMTASVLIDHFGVVGFRPHPISLQRIIGGALVVLGMILVQTD
ncbi:MAG: DMT family transporter [Myxococcales bacterium]|jgi:transporter family-2 protein|nr:MAG: DMT family transporter [Myxococcales bacterium]